MSRNGMKLAESYDNKLLSFPNQQEAEKTLLALKDEFIARILSLSNNASIFKADFTPDSLKHLEKWFFELYENNLFGNIGTSQSEFETCMAIYFGNVAVENKKAKWVVEKYFLDNDKYTIGIRRDEHFSQTLGGYRGLPLRKNNKKRDSIFREYKRFYDD
jgi:hypothetical protein